MTDLSGRSAGCAEQEESVMRCDQCKHWFVETRRGYSEWEAKAVGFGECKAVRQRWTIQDDASRDLDRWADDAAEDRWTEARRNALKAARAYVQDGSEYRAELYTAPDFFCALYEPTEAMRDDIVTAAESAKR